MQNAVKYGPNNIRTRNTLAGAGPKQTASGGEPANAKPGQFTKKTSNFDLSETKMSFQICKANL